MKLMIDIPDKIYETVQNGTYCGTLYEELKNGTPLSESEDCVGRQAVEDAIAEMTVNGESLGYAVAYDILSDLPPVKPEQKNGEWIIYDVHGHKACKCSKCNNDVGYPCTDKYCKYCGAKMVEPQAERSDKE